MGTWVLIFVILNGSQSNTQAGKSMLTQEFSSEVTCSSAAIRLEKLIRDQNTGNAMTWECAPK